MRRTLRWSALTLLATLALPAVATLAQEARTLRLQGRASVDRRTHIVGAVVHVFPEGDSSRVYLTSTDDAGAFRIEGLREGMYTVTLDRTGFSPVIKEGVRLKFPFRAVVEVRMEPSDDPIPDALDYATPVASKPITIRGRVFDRDEAGQIDEARVRFVHPEGEQNPRLLESNTDGTFMIVGIPSGPWELLVDAVGYIGLDVVLDLDQDTEINLALVRQPADYDPTPFELMPPERLTPPADFDVKLVIR